MIKIGLLARLEAKPGKEQELADFVRNAKTSVEQEPDTVNWYALQIGDSTFVTFFTFENKEGLQAHMDSPVVKALMEKAPELLAQNPVIEHAEILAVK